MAEKSVENVAEKAEVNKRIGWDSSHFFIPPLHSVTPFYDSNGAGNRSGIKKKKEVQKSSARCRREFRPLHRRPSVGKTACHIKVSFAVTQPEGILYTIYIPIPIPQTPFSQPAIPGD